MKGFPSAVTAPLLDKEADYPPSLTCQMPLHWLKWQEGGPEDDRAVLLRAYMRIGGACHVITAIAVMTVDDEWKFDGEMGTPSPASFHEIDGIGDKTSTQVWDFFGMEGSPDRVLINGREYVLFMCPVSG